MKLYTAAITLFTAATVIGTGNAKDRNLRRGLELFKIKIKDSVSAHHIIMLMLQSSSHFPMYS